MVKAAWTRNGHGAKSRAAPKWHEVGAHTAEDVSPSSEVKPEICFVCDCDPRPCVWIQMAAASLLSVTKLIKSAVLLVAQLAQVKAPLLQRHVNLDLFRGQ